jgi:penicillin-binding protein activator
MKMCAMLSAAAMIGLTGCASENWKVKRVDPSAPTDVDYRFNDEDARQVLAAMSADCMSRPWIDTFMRENGGRQPIVFLGSIKNNTQDYINTQLYTTDLERELLNGGRVRVKAERDLRQELRDERLDTKYNDPATLKAVAKELNADFALVGFVNDNKQRSNDGRTIVNYYQFDMQLINVETAEKVWIQTKPIKKVATR